MTQAFAQIPMQSVGPIKITGNIVNDDLMLPMATYETPLWPSVNRGARVFTKAGGLQATLVDERMTRSILVKAKDAQQALDAWRSIDARREDLQAVVAQSSRFAKLIDIHAQFVGRLLYLRLEFTTGDASGHNMVTNAADHLMRWVLNEYPELAYGSISGNLCTDKKVSAVNGLLGRGKNVVTECVIPRKLCIRFLKTTPEKMVELNVQKNLVGTNLAGGLRSANAHYANMLLGFFLATGQDAANIIEGSQGIVYCEVQDGDLYFSVNIPNLIVGSVGNGKGLDFVQENLALLGCTQSDVEPGENARRLAIAAAACVACGELSLLAAQTNPGELMESHIRIEREHSL